MLNFPRPRSLSLAVFLHPPSAHRHFPVLHPSTCLILLSPLVLVFPHPLGFRPTGFRLSLFLLSSGESSLATSARLLPQPSLILISLLLNSTSLPSAKSSIVYFSSLCINLASSAFLAIVSFLQLFLASRVVFSRRGFLLLLLWSDITAGLLLPHVFHFLPLFSVALCVRLLSSFIT